MAKKLKINFKQTQTIREAFADFLLQKKALGLADKTIETYSHHFDIISKYLDSSAPIAGLFKRPLDEMIERMEFPMKKLLVVLLALMALLSVSAMAETVDAFSSASVADYYGAAALTGDDLMNAINSQSGTYLISTTNPDGSPNTAYFIFGMKKVEDKYYVQLGLAENQSKANLLANGEGLAIYAANPSNEEGAKDYTVSGARVRFSTIQDQAVADKLNAEASRPGALFYEVVEVRPLG